MHSAFEVFYRLSNFKFSSATLLVYIQEKIVTTNGDWRYSFAHY